MVNFEEDSINPENIINQEDSINQEDGINLLPNVNSTKTELTEFFELNKKLIENKQEHEFVTYIQCPEKFKYDAKKRSWVERKQSTERYQTLGRLPLLTLGKAGDTYYLRMLLLHPHSKGKRSFKELKTVNGVIQENYKDVCKALDLLLDDQEWNTALQEATLLRMSSSTRLLFVTILVFGEPLNPRLLFDTYWKNWIDDFKYRAREKMSI